MWYRMSNRDSGPPAAKHTWICQLQAPLVGIEGLTSMVPCDRVSHQQLPEGIASPPTKSEKLKGNACGRTAGRVSQPLQRDAGSR